MRHPLEEFQFTNENPPRLLRPEERELIRYLLLTVAKPYPLSSGLLETSKVHDLNDGGMGSVRFLVPPPQIFGKILAEAAYTDADGVLVLITINADQLGRLFEIDFWKADFGTLRRYPHPDALNLKRDTG